MGAVTFSLTSSANSPSPLSLAFSAFALALASLFSLAFSPPLSKAFFDSSNLFASASLVFSSKAFKRATRAAVWALTVSSEGGDGLGSRGTRWAMPFFVFVFHVSKNNGDVSKKDEFVLPWVTRYAVSSCINVRGRPKNPFCWATPGSVPALKPETLCTQWRVAAAVKRGCQLGRMSWRGWRLDTLCVPDGGDTVYEVEGDGVGGRGHGLWREGSVCAERG